MIVEKGKLEGKEKIEDYADLPFEHLAVQFAVAVGHKPLICEMKSH